MLDKSRRCTPVGSGFPITAGRAKAKVRDPGTIKMVEAAYVKLSDHLWYLNERFVPVALFIIFDAKRSNVRMFFLC